MTITEQAHASAKTHEYPVTAGSKPEGELPPNAQKLMEDRYLRRLNGGFEPPHELFRRVAKSVASADMFYRKNTEDVARTEEAFYAMLSGLEFLPNSPTLLNAGSRFGQLSACFVLPVEDSIQGIFFHPHERRGNT
jgi:ribonucleoside-diphosphate reductase alpha chain